LGDFLDILTLTLAIIKGFFLQNTATASLSFPKLFQGKDWCAPLC